MPSAEHTASPLEQSLRLSYRLLLGVTLLAGLAWLFGHVRPIPADSQAVVLRFGAVERVQHAGLLLAWPSPIEEVLLLPAGERLQQRQITGLARNAHALALDGAGTALRQMGDELAGSGYLLSGDLGVVQLNATVYYQIDDAMAYAVQGEQALPALDRLVSAAALQLSAGRDLDSILVSRGSTASGQLAIQRERLRAELVAAANQRLQALRQRGVALGIRIVRIDLLSSLPHQAQAAFDAVLTADQTVERQLALARTAAAQQQQYASAAVSTLLNNARAHANERLAQARSETTEISALAPHMQQSDGPELLRQLYRNRMQSVLAKAGQLSTIAPDSSSRLILPGVRP
ncbi:SPFH domain-containing protein [Aquitalea aquatica]|uniref:Protease modulator HflK n=1 Tax=Aquitalea aquatica TaxID=3044273 RepID=A0A838YHA7_9NEIS|nr:SPFH domain-containing protein [Aquitalea magnusonii]MBA4710094.1 protease modulator HflK [Aquitalea magnusonii]